MRSAISTGWPSTVSAMPPMKSRSSPVAVTMMSASSSAPDRSRMPVSVKVSMWSVTTDGATVADGPEQVAVGDDAEPLVPRVVVRA